MLIKVTTRKGKLATMQQIVPLLLFSVFMNKQSAIFWNFNGSGHMNYPSVIKTSDNGYDCASHCLHYITGTLALLFYFVPIPINITDALFSSTKLTC